MLKVGYTLEIDKSSTFDWKIIKINIKFIKAILCMFFVQKHSEFLKYSKAPLTV